VIGWSVTSAGTISFFSIFFLDFAMLTVPSFR